MTGQEKVQYLIDIIKKASNELIAGDIVIVRSDELDSIMTIEEQIQAFDKLANEKYIEYKASPLYPSFDDIDPRTRLDINEIASMNGVVTEAELEESLLAILNYKIKILSLPSLTQINYGKNKITFDAKTSLLIYHDKECPVPDETLQHHTCRLVFKNRNIPAKEQDIIEAAGVGDNSQRPVYDAMLKVNKLIQTHFGLPKYLKYKAAKVRINSIYKE